MNVNRKCFFVSSWPNSVRAFSTFAWTWRKTEADGFITLQSSGELQVVLNAREQDPHGVRPIVQEGNPRSVQLLGQLVDGHSGLQVVHLELQTFQRAAISTAMMTNRSKPPPPPMPIMAGSVSRLSE
ncbi:hypothetical protein EYF80_030432 [Liparis tanakae]|uniref:Uncharacterized protein n=1 Tax=Liparis tanakae TaxID=230148 RepID=A0A4Z2H0N8_9TELE|nr:hypothetical protein EYF80_030432 [Liparis tanakae]